MADPNLKFTALGLLPYPVENVDDWWYIWDQSSNGTMNSIEQMLVALRGNMAVAVRPVGSFWLNVVQNRVEWSDNVYFYFPGGGYSYQIGGGNVTCNDGDWVYLADVNPGRPIAAGGGSPNMIQAAAVVPVEFNRRVPICRRVGNRLVFPTAHPPLLETIDPEAGTTALTPEDSGSVVSNLYSTAGKIHVTTLPSATIGAEFLFQLKDAPAMEVFVDGADSIIGPDGQDNASMLLPTYPVACHLVCIDGKHWEIVGGLGGIVLDVTGEFFFDGPLVSIGLGVEGRGSNNTDAYNSRNIFLGGEAEVLEPTALVCVHHGGGGSGSIWQAARYFSNGRAGWVFNDKGSSQGQDGLHLRAYTDGAASADLTDGADSAVLYLRDDRAYSLSMNIVAKNGLVDDEVVMFKVEMGVLGGHGVQDSIIVGVPSVTRVAETANGDEALWGLAFSIQAGSPDVLRITCTGAAGDRVVWSANIRGAEVEGFASA